MKHSHKVSRKGSKKSRKGSRKGSKKSRKGSKKSRKGSKKSRKGSKKSRKGSKKSRKGSKKSRKGSKTSSKSQYSVLAYYKKKLPTISSTSAVKIVRKQHGTDDDGKTYYVDAVVSASSSEDVKKYFKNKANFMNISELNKQ